MANGLENGNIKAEKFTTIPLPNDYAKPKTSRMRRALPQILAVMAKNLLLLSYGLTIGYTTIAIPSLQGDVDNTGRVDSLRLTQSQISWFSSINYIMVPLGATVSGVISEPLGRRRSMQLINVPFIIAWIIFHFSERVEFLYLSLILIGLSAGILEAPVLTYVAEITQPYLRGMLSATSTMSIIVGSLIVFFFGTILNWRTIALVNLVFPCIAFTALCFIPESPHWLISKNRFDDAKKSIAWLRGWTSVDEIMPEYNAIYDLVFHKSEKSNGKDGVKFSNSKFDVNNYMQRSFLMPLGIISFGFFLLHFSGMTTLQTFSVSIFKGVKAPINHYTATLCLGVAEVLGTLASVIFIHVFGKRHMTFFSLTGVATCFIIAAMNAYSVETGLTDLNPIKNDVNWVPLVALVSSAFFSHVGIRLLPWMLIGEVFPNNVRLTAAGLASGIGYIFGFFANYLFQTLKNNFNLSGTFFINAGVSVAGLIVLYIILPETEGKPLNEIQLHFEGKIKLRNSVRRRKTRLAGVNEGVHGVADSVILESEVFESKM